MNELLDDKIKKIEYFFFIKKLKEKIIIKKEKKSKIILFQKSLALEQLLINVMSEIKNEILNEKLKRLLVKKFLYTVIEQYIEHYKNGNNINSYNNDNYDINEKRKLEEKKAIIKEYILKNDIYSFLNGVSICMNNRRIKYIQYNYSIKNRLDNIKLYFMKIKEFNYISYSNKKKKIMCHIFFDNIKIRLINKQKNINLLNESNNKINLFITKNIFHNFLYNCKEINNNIIIKEKIKKYKESNYIKDIRNKTIKKYFNLFINRTKIIKQANDSLKRKIFNLIKYNVKLSKDLNHYLQEATEVE